ncbi:hypothetical protein [Litoribaculum gwangyangense]|uniref:Uncharacterized protein n=1 Tax=Litoribaculum gwangyangense TaxID=1130722 RepID=A0ABP9CTQ2_9FLAO
MIKKSISLLFMVLICISANFTVNAQEGSKNYTMLESIMLTPDNAKLKVLGDNIRAHNAKYHKDGVYKSSVYNISTGPNTGNIVWMMGPLMFKHLDARPSANGHDEDWRDNVMPYIKKVHTSEYWTMDDKLSNMSMMDGDNSKFPIVFVRYGEVDDDHGYAMDSFFEMVGKTVKAMDGVNPWGLYYNQFRQGNLGRHVAAVSFYKNWTDFDNDVSFRDTFDKTIGKDQWQKFINMGDSVFTNTWDEIWTFNAYMSGQ